MDINELLKGYQPDPNFKKEHEQREAAIAKREQEVKLVERDFINAWLSSGFPQIEFTSDITTMKKRLATEQVELILTWIPKMANTFSQEMLVRALILAGKPFDGQVLMKLFDDPDSTFHLKWAIGNTIDSTNVRHVQHWLKDKFETLSLGKEKEMLVCALPKYLNTDEAREYLVKIFDHYPLHAADTLAKIGDEKDLSFLIDKLAGYKGPAKAAISKAIKKLKKRLR